MKMQKEHGKTSVAGAIIASVCIVIYLFALVSSAVRIYFSIDQRRITAEIEFNNIADLASSAGVLGFMNEPFIETMNDALATSRTIEAFIITGPEGEYAFERQKNHSVRWVNNSPRFINRFDLSGQSLYMPLRIQGLRNVNIQAVAGSIDYSAISVILKETLIIILAGLILAFFTLILESMLGRSAEASSSEKESTVRVSADTGEDDDAALVEQELPLVSEPVLRNKPETVSGGKPKPKLRAVDSSVAPSADKPSVQEPDAEEDGPKGLYSPRSNLGWEEYTAERLDAVLHRCASSEQDMVFFAIEFRNVESGFISDLANEAVAFFTSKDLLFERGEKGISVIYPDLSIETGIAKSREFHSRVMDKYPQVLKNTDLCIGLTSRSGRLVSASRLFLEAGEALKRAKLDPADPILAFKSDPDKYRAYITSQNQRQS